MPSIFSADWRNEINREIEGKAGIATTLAGYGIGDAYTKGQTESAISAAVTNASTDISSQLALKLDASAATSFLAADGSVDANKLVVNSSTGASQSGGGLTVRGQPSQANVYFEPSSGYGHFLHANPSEFYILADRNRNRTWDTGRYPLQLKSDVDRGYLYGREIFTFAGGQLTGKLTSQALNANTAVGDANVALEIQNVAGGGDGAVAAISFHCKGAYGIKLHLRPDGYFGLGGWSSQAWRWYSVSNGDMIAAGNIGAYSDPRLKEEVARIDDALDIVDQLDGVRFQWNHKTTLIGRPGERDIGVLADQVEAVLPEIVSRSIEDEANGGERWRVVAYDKLVPVLIEAVKALRRENRALAARLAKLEGNQ